MTLTSTACSTSARPRSITRLVAAVPCGKPNDRRRKTTWTLPLRMGMSAAVSPAASREDEPHRRVPVPWPASEPAGYAPHDEAREACPALGKDSPRRRPDAPNLLEGWGRHVDVVKLGHCVPRYRRLSTVSPAKPDATGAWVVSWRSVPPGLRLTSRLFDPDGRLRSPFVPDNGLLCSQSQQVFCARAARSRRLGRLRQRGQGPQVHVEPADFSGEHCWKCPFHKRNHSESRRCDTTESRCRRGLLGPRHRSRDVQEEQECNCTVCSYSCRADSLRCPRFRGSNSQSGFALHRGQAHESLCGGETACRECRREARPSIRRTRWEEDVRSRRNDARECVSAHRAPPQEADTDTGTYADACADADTGTYADACADTDADTGTYADACADGHSNSCSHAVTLALADALVVQSEFGPPSSEAW